MPSLLYQARRLCSESLLLHKPPSLSQAIFIARDPEIRDPATKQWAMARNSNIIEDLGRCSYVFSDKTGTLTSNEMRLRGVAVKGTPYGSADFRRVLEGLRHFWNGVRVWAHDIGMTTMSSRAQAQFLWF